MFQDQLQDDVPEAVLQAPPSTETETEDSATLSLPEPLTDTVPPTELDELGAVIETVGADLSVGPFLPAASAGLSSPETRTEPATAAARTAEVGGRSTGSLPISGGER
ncbi:hypothetical protein GCM10009815_01450 [Nocardioides marmoribigeumensis]